MALFEKQCVVVVGGGHNTLALGNTPDDDHHPLWYHWIYSMVLIAVRVPITFLGRYIYDTNDCCHYYHCHGMGWYCR